MRTFKMKIKSIYFEDDLLEAIGETKDFSKRIKGLIRRGLEAEKNQSTSVKQSILALVRAYNGTCKNPITPDMI